VEIKGFFDRVFSFHPISPKQIVQAFFQKSELVSINEWPFCPDLLFPRVSAAELDAQRHPDLKGKPGHRGALEGIV